MNRNSLPALALASAVARHGYLAWVAKHDGVGLEAVP